MNSYLFQQLFRTWNRHWILQLASVTVMTMVLVLLNFLFLAFSAADSTIQQWATSLEMVVYLKDGTAPEAQDQIREAAEVSGQFDKVEFVSKDTATQKFLASLGPESLELLKDPKWSSPIPSSFELKLSSAVPIKARVPALESWGARFKALGFVEDVFYGQGWVENFSSFISSARGALALLWILSLGVGLLVIGNCIRLSFWQRRDEIEILELVGATSRFVRAPFLFEGLVLGFVASVASLLLSFVFHGLLVAWMAKNWPFWTALSDVPPLPGWAVALNLVTALAFGLIGAWNCVRKINTGWSAAVS